MSDQLDRIFKEGTARSLSSRGNWKTGKPSNWIECTDGFRVSVIAGEGTYCSPRPTTFPQLEVDPAPATYEGPYQAVEVGYPSTRPEPWDAWSEYCENEDDPTATVYGYVPTRLVRALVDSHGGIA